jgi:DCN1-like protein 3
MDTVDPPTSVQVSPGAIASPSKQDVPRVNHQRGSFSAGGERSVPSRQFSLTRQPPSASSSSSSSAPSQSTQTKHAHIEKYFNKYKDIGEESILAEGMERFCIDLGVDPTEFIVLVLAWKFEASQMCRFTREEFMNGCQKMQAHNAKSLRDRFPDLLAEAKDKKHFKDLYNFTFSFGLDHSSGQRSLPIEMAVELWKLVFFHNKPNLLDRWFVFLKQSEVKGISRDTWNMFLPFMESMLPDLSNYDESEAWPSLFDDFVEGELSDNTTL